MPPMPNPQAIQDADHIKVLVICHYVLAGITALGASIPIIHVVMGVMMISGGFGSSPGASAAELKMMGWMFAVMGGMFVVLGWALAICIFFAGKFLSERRRRTFVFVIACISCLNVPIGTVLGVFTLLILERPSVKGLFEGSNAGVGQFR